MNTNDIINAIDNDFSKVYTTASNFVNSGDVWNFCMYIIKNPVSMNKIVYDNNNGTPPVYTVLNFYKSEKNPDEGFGFGVEVNKNIGRLMGFVFKEVLGYTDQKDSCTINILGVKTAALFLNGPVVTFEN